MAKFQPAGLEWMNKGLKTFNKEILNTAELMKKNATSVKEVTLSMKNLNKETGEWVKRTAKVMTGTEGITTTFVEMTREVDDAGDAIITTDLSIKAMDRTGRGVGGRGGGIGIMTAAISGLSAAVGLFLLNALKNLIKFGLKAIVQALILPVKGFLALGKVVAKITFAGFKAGAELVKNVLVGVGEAAAWAMRKIADMGATMLQAGIDFQEGFTGIKKAGTAIVDAAGNITELGRAVREDFIDLIREVPLMPEEILRIGELGAQLDVPDKDLARFAEVVGAVTKATVLSAEDAALGMGKIASVMGLSVDEFEQMGSVVVWLGNNMGIVEDEILLMAKRITGVGKVAGWTTDEIFAISAAVLRLGATPYAGASAVQRGIQAITAAVARGGDELEMFSALAGMSSDQFVQSWRELPADTFLEFIKGLTLSGEDAILILDELGLANVRTSQSYLSLASAPEELDKALTGSRQAWIDNTALAREAQLRYETVASKIQLLKNQFSILGVYLFDFVEPVIRRIIGLGGRLVTWAGPLMGKAFESLQPHIETITKWLDWLREKMVLVFSGPNLARSFFNELLTIFGVFGEQRKDILAVFDEISEMISGLGVDIDWGVVWRNVQEWFGKAIDWVIENWPKIKAEIDKVIEWFEGISWESIRSHVSAGLQTVIDIFVENWPKVLDTIKDTTGNIMDFLLGEEYEVPVTLGGRELGEAARRTGGFLEGFASGFDKIRDSAIGLADTIVNTLVPAIQEMVQNLAIMFGMDAEDAFKDPVAAGEFLAEAISTAIDKYSDLLEIISFAGVEATRTGPASPEQLERTHELVDPILFGGEEFEEDRTWLGKFVDWWNDELPGLSDKMPKIGLAIKDAIIDPLSEVLSEYYGFTSGFEAETERFGGVIVYNSLFPDIMDAIVDVFRVGFGEIETLFSTFWTGTTTEASTGANSFLAAMGVEQGGSSQGLLATIERSYSSFKDAGRSIVQAIADGMLEAAYLMVDALRANIDALNVAVDTDEAINNILFDIGEKIVQKIANAILKSYTIIYDALELALSLGGQLISAAAAAAQGGGGGGVVTDVVDSSQQVITDTAGAVTAPAGGYGAGYTPAGLSQPTTQGEAVQVNINVGSVRDDMDMAAIETVVRRTIAEEIA